MNILLKFLLLPIWLVGQIFGVDIFEE